MKGNTLGYNEQETRYFLIDPVLRQKGYDDHQWLKLETPAPVEPTGPKGRRRRGLVAPTTCCVYGCRRYARVVACCRPGSQETKRGPVKGNAAGEELC